MTEEERVAADERPAVPAGAGEARPDGRMCEAGPAESWSAEMSEVRTAAHAADMHATKAARVHSATEMATSAEATMSPAPETTTMAAAPASTSGEHGRSDR